jgi:hypothetical protein
MNRELKNRIFDVPQNVLDLINHAIDGLNGKNVRGIQRAKKLLSDKTVKYGQLKRIIHDLQNIDKINDRLKYELCGGDVMFTWAKQYMKGERDLISNRKDSRKRADDMGGLTGERKNSHLKKHTKKFDFRIPTNLIKSNSHKNTISPLKITGLFEEISKIKKLM